MIAIIILAVVGLAMVVTDFRRNRLFRKKRRSPRAVSLRPNIIATTMPDMGRWERFVSLHPQVRELIYLPIIVGGAAGVSLVALALT